MILNQMTNKYFPLEIGLLIITWHWRFYYRKAEIQDFYKEIKTINLTMARL